MNNMNRPLDHLQARQSEVAVTTGFLSGVFLWMFLALALTAATAYLFATTESLISLLYNSETGGMTMFGWIILFAPLGLVFLISARYNKMSSSSMVMLFVIYAILIGASLSFILLVYTGASIAKTFLVTSAMFGFMAVLGYTTKTDLTKFGSLMLMGLVGIIIASLVNMFMGSSTLDYIISFIGVLIFTGLTAYDVQKLKRIGEQIVDGTESARKVTIMGALTLYLDFINLFLFLLRFLGDRK